MTVNGIARVVAWVFLIAAAPVAWGSVLWMRHKADRRWAERAGEVDR